MLVCQPCRPGSPCRIPSSCNPGRTSKLGVTGLLCYGEDVFIQVLEGGRDEVCELYNAIVQTTATNVRILSFEEIRERRFGGWTMGQVNLAKVNPSLLLKYGERPALSPFDCSGQATMALLEELIASSLVVNRG